MNDVIVRQAPALALGETLLKMLADPAIPADKMQILLNMQKDIMAENRREQFQTAFATMAPEMPRVSKLGTVELVKDGRKLGSYKYAKWEDMDEVVRPILHKHGFSLSFASRLDDKGRSILVGTLMHSAGHFIISERPLIPDPGPGRNNLQAEGSGLSYAKRYIGEGLLNIIRKGVDDDGIAAGLQPLGAEQVKELSALLSKTGTKTENFLLMFVTGVEKLEDVPMRDFPRLKNALQSKLESMIKKDKK
jgi:hypothetical protein